MRRWWLLVGPLLWCLLTAAGPASATTQPGSEHIASYDVVLTVRPDGRLAVRETIDYDFGPQERHGIYREIPTRVPYDNDHDRVYRLSDVQVTSPTGAPADVSRDESGGLTRLRVGNPDRTVHGRQTYVVSYVVDGALNAFSDHVELYWNAIGAEWAVPIAEASVRVVAPGPVRRSACFAGPTGSGLPCASPPSSTGSGGADFAEPGGLAAYNAFTVVVALDQGSVATTGPILAEHWSLRRSVVPTPLTGGLAAGLVVVGGVGLAWLVGTRGRDRRFAGQTPGLLPLEGAHPREEAAPLLSREPVAVAFTPPEGLRPGQVGTLLDERASVLDVTATIVDLAVRGFLRIEELERTHWFSSRDWRLVRLDPPAPDPPLLPYEQDLYAGLFQSGTEVLLSGLKTHFASRLQAVQDKLYVDVTAAGWFRGRPDKVRGRYAGAGVLLAAAGGWLTWTLAHHVHWPVVGVAITVLGLALWRLAGRMPARTARGSAVLAQAKGFRQYIRTAEGEQLRFEEGADIFSRYLPYAIVFGEADRWVRVFGALSTAAGGSAASAPSWYAGPSGWTFGSFSDSLDGFTSSTTGAIAAATPSSSGGSGFSGGSSGGGGGGGGGGSW